MEINEALSESYEHLFHSAAVKAAARGKEFLLGGACIPMLSGTTCR